MVPQSLLVKYIWCFYWVFMQVKGQGCECKRCTKVCQRVNLPAALRPRQREEQESNRITLRKTGSSHTTEHVLVSLLCGTKP